MQITWEEIVATIHNRQMNDAKLLSKMIEVRQRYNAEWVLPYTDEQENQTLVSTTPMLVAEAVDFLAMKAASVMPHMSSPVLDPSKEAGTKSRERATVRRKILGGTHHKSHTKLHMRKAFRHLAGYSTATFVVVPDLERSNMPRLELRDPLTTYPEPRAAEDLRPPSNCAVIYPKSVNWLRACYPQTRPLFGEQLTGTELWDLAEWMDEDCTVIGVIGPRDQEVRTLGANGYTIPSMELHRWENPTKICPVYTPQRITLDRIISQIGNLTGQVDLMARLQSLAIAAGEKSIYRDRYIIGDSINAPQLVGGNWKDGRTGDVNIVLNAKQIGELAGTPDPNTQMMIDRIERNVRVSTGLVPAAGGETYGALRTGRGIDSMMGAAVDPRVQEMQEIMEVALEHVNTVMLEQYKAYWPTREYSFHSGWSGDQGIVEFTPEKHIETTENTVSYAIPGADVQGTTIELGQLYGLKAISLHTVRTQHPYIADPDGEASRVEEEMLEQAILEGIATQAAQGAIPITYLAKIEQFRKKEPDIVQAVLKADEWMKNEQAKLAPPPGEGQGASPAQMPGLAPPGTAPVPPGAPPGAMPPEMAGMGPEMGAGPPGGGPPPEAPAGPGEVGPTDNQRGLRRLMEALSQAAPAQ